MIKSACLFVMPLLVASCATTAPTKNYSQMVDEISGYTAQQESDAVAAYRAPCAEADAIMNQLNKNMDSINRTLDVAVKTNNPDPSVIDEATSKAARESSGLKERRENCASLVHHANEIIARRSSAAKHAEEIIASRQEVVPTYISCLSTRAGSAVYTACL